MHTVALGRERWLIQLLAECRAADLKNRKP
jgi:hypothetical protein